MEANKLYGVLDRYFKRLSQVGYIPDNSTFSVLILVYIAKLEKEKVKFELDPNKDIPLDDEAAFNVGCIYIKELFIL